jgi:hypothetical protein
MLNGLIRSECLTLSRCKPRLDHPAPSSASEYVPGSRLQIRLRPPFGLAMNSRLPRTELVQIGSQQQDLFGCPQTACTHRTNGSGKARRKIDHKLPASRVFKKRSKCQQIVASVTFGNCIQHKEPACAGSKSFTQRVPRRTSQSRRDDPLNPPQQLASHMIICDRLIRRTFREG